MRNCWATWDDPPSDKADPGHPWVRIKGNGAGPTSLMNEGIKRVIDARQELRELLRRASCVPIELLPPVTQDAKRRSGAKYSYRPSRHRATGPANVMEALLEVSIIPTCILYADVHGSTSRFWRHRDKLTSSIINAVLRTEGCGQLRRRSVRVSVIQRPRPRLRPKLQSTPPAPRDTPETLADLTFEGGRPGAE